MLTPAGWCLLLAGLLMLAAGRILGLIEFYVAGAAAIAAVLTALLVRRLRLVWVSVSREVSPRLVVVGESALIQLEVVNHGHSTSPCLRLHDAVSASNGVQLSVPPLPRGGRRRGSYRLPTSRRGVILIGPLRVDVIDSTGLARSSRRTLRRIRLPVGFRLIVHPPIEALSGAQRRGSEDPTLGEQLQKSVAPSSEEYDGLREYVSGDDPRRIHWHSTAHFDELMVRQDRQLRNSRISIVIDTRPPGDLEVAQDLTSEIAASVAACILAEGDAVRVQASDGRTTPLLSDGSQLDILLEFLALLAGGSTRIHPAVPDSGSTIIAISAAPDAASDATVRERLIQRLHASLLVTCDSSQWGHGSSAGHRTDNWIHLTGPGQLPALWSSPAHGAARMRV